jgi:hypothetical protein
VFTARYELSPYVRSVYSAVRDESLYKTDYLSPFEGFSKNNDNLTLTFTPECY